MSFQYSLARKIERCNSRRRVLYQRRRWNVIHFGDDSFRDSFQQRIESQKNIKLFLEDIFKQIGKEKINIDDFIKINQNITSEMFLSVSTKV